jgi:uncharacterized protein (TIGR03083 family)
MESLLADLSDDQWQSPSRCAGWTVQDVVAHLVGVNAFWEASVVAGLAGTPTQVLAAFDPAAHPPLMVAPMRALTPQEILEQFVASNDGFLGAVAGLDDDGWSTPAETPAGHVPIRLLAFHGLWDAWIHERDIALPLGLTPPEEPDEISSSLRYAAALGPALTISGSEPCSGGLAVLATEPDIQFTLDVDEWVSVHDAIAAADVPCLRGPAVELTEALSLRAPLPATAPDAWRRHLGSLATMFDTELEPSP